MKMAKKRRGGKREAVELICCVEGSELRHKLYRNGNGDLIRRLKYARHVILINQSELARLGGFSGPYDVFITSREELSGANVGFAKRFIENGDKIAAIIYHFTPINHSTMGIIGLNLTYHLSPENISYSRRMIVGSLAHEIKHAQQYHRLCQNIIWRYVMHRKALRKLCGFIGRLLSSETEASLFGLAMRRNKDWLRCVKVLPA